MAAPGVSPTTLLPTVGGQTALNLAIALDDAGVLEENGVEMIGAKREAIKVAEDRLLFKKAMDEINKTNQDIEKPELSKDGKEKLAKQRDEKVQEARNLDREIAEFRQARERQLQEQFMRMRKDIIDDIMKVVNEKVKAGGYDLVLDKTGVSMGQVPVVLYSRGDLDFSNDIITALNKNAPKPSSAAN